MEADALAAGEQVKPSARHSCQLTEVVQHALIHIDSANTTPLSNDVAYAGRRTIEALAPLPRPQQK